MLFDPFKHVAISVMKEGKLLDQLIHWGNMHACVDLAGVFPLVGQRSSVSTVGQTALKVVSFKMTKHEKACLDNQNMFVPFAFDTFDLLASKTVEPLSHVQ